jgi:acyl-homoserine lactone synthase
MQFLEMASIGRDAPQRYQGISGAMHRDRKRVFVDRLGWRVPVLRQEFEVDEFDDEHATYLVVAGRDAPDRHLGSVRLLTSTRPHILGDIFPELCAGEIPRGPEVMEITRLCIAPGADGVRTGMTIRRRLAIGLTEFALLHDIRTYTLVCALPHLPQVLAAGWNVSPLGLPAAIEGQMLCAARIDITPATLPVLRGTHGHARRERKRAPPPPGLGIAA